MFEKRCQLCGGKLGDNKCILCGLDNSKSDANYKLNQSSCDHQPLTHVHEEKPQKNQSAGKKTVPVRNAAAKLAVRTAPVRRVGQKMEFQDFFTERALTMVRNTRKMCAVMTGRN